MGDGMSVLTGRKKKVRRRGEERKGYSMYRQRSGSTYAPCHEVRGINYRWLMPHCDGGFVEDD
jgi:hypothetical protein